MIGIKDLTMQYPNGKGIFDVDFTVEKGQVVGFLGPNGAGKTTTIRCILGFMRGQKGKCFIDGNECFANAPKIMQQVGFIAGEPAFPDGMTGVEYLDFLCEVRGLKDKARMNELIEYFEFDAKSKIKKMSKGMKQKTAIVAAFMHNPSVLILDEPTSGLDPLMQNKFVELILSEKTKGKTILMSSHMFDEVEKTCEHVLIIKDGRIISRDFVKNLKRTQKVIFEVTSSDKIKTSFDAKAEADGKYEITIPYDQVDKLVKELSKFKIDWIKMKEQTLENIFLDLYKKEKTK